MSIPRELDSESFNALSAADKKLYQANDEGAYIFMAENPAELRRAHERVKQKERESRQRYEDQQRKYEELEDRMNKMSDAKMTEEEGKAKREGQIDRLEASYKSKLERAEAKYKKELQKRDAFIDKNLIDLKAQNIAQEVSRSPDLMADLIKQRMRVNFSKEDPEVEFRDPDGTYGVWGIDELVQEIKTEDKYKYLLKSSGTQAKGSGVTPATAAPDQRNLRIPTQTPHAAQPPTHELMGRQPQQQEQPAAQTPELDKPFSQMTKEQQVAYIQQKHATTPPGELSGSLG